MNQYVERSIEGTFRLVIKFITNQVYGNDWVKFNNNMFMAQIPYALWSAWQIAHNFAQFVSVYTDMEGKSE